MDQIGRYRIESELGRGGFGCVYRAIDPTVGRHVAIKVLVSEGDQDLLARFRNEAAAAGKLRHKNIVTIYDYGEQDGVPYLVMEYLDGQDLEKVHATGRQLTLFEKVSIMSQVAEGLRHAHLNGIVHRDVKPANIMLLADGSAKIMDFGIARLITSRSTRLTQHGNLIGTLPYMAPEQFQGGEVDELCDIFAFGTIFYWLISGVQPFSAADPGSVIYRVTSVDPAPVQSLAPSCPIALADVITRAMQKPRELRYQSLEDLQFDTAPIRLQLEAELSVTYIRNAEKEYETGNIEDANRLIRLASELNPNNPRARELRDRIRHDAQLKMVRERSAAALTAARNQLLAGQFTDAIRVLETALRVDPENAELSTVLEDVKNAAARARRAAILLEEARRELASHNLTGAYRSAMECLQNAPDNQEASALLTAIRREIELRERERRLQEMLAQVEAHAAAQSYDEALALLADLEAGYPSSQRVKQLLAAVHFAREEQERQRHLAAELDSAKAKIAAAQWQEAVEQLEALRRQFPANSEVETLLAYSRDEFAAQRKAAEIERILRESRMLAESKEFQSALNLINGGLRAWPDDPALTTVAARVEEARRVHERECAVDEVTRRVKDHLGFRRYGEALVEVNAAIRAWDSVRLKELRSQVEQEAAEYERGKAIEDLCAAAGHEVEAGRYADAIHGLELGLERYGPDQRLEDLLAGAKARLEEQRRQLAIDKAIRESNAAAGRGEFEPAMGGITEALLRYPDDEALAAQLRRVEAQRLDHLRRRAESLGQSGRWPEALELVEGLLREYRSDGALLQLQRSIAEDWERHKREQAIMGALERAERLRADGQLEAALGTIVEGLEKFAGDERLVRALEEIEQLREAERRATDIKGTAERASQLLRRQQFEEATQELTAGLERNPDADSLTTLLGRVREAQAEAERRAAIQRVLADASALLAAEEFDQTISILQTGIAELSRPSELASLLDHASEAKEAKQRRVAVEHAVEHGSGLLAKESHDAAIAVVQRTLDIYPGEAQLTALLHRALDAKADFERKRRVGAALDAAAKLRESGDPVKAIRALDPVLREYPDEKPLREAYAALQKEIERRTALDQLLARAHVFKRSGELDAALRTLDEAQPEFPGDPQIEKLRAELERARIDAEVTAAVNSIETLRLNGYLREAAAELATALQRYPNHKALVRLQAPIAADLEALQRREAAGVVARDAQALLDQGKLSESIAALEEGLVVYPGEAELVTLLAYVQETVEARRRADAIAEVSKSARTLLKNGKPGEAVAMLDAARQKYPNEESLVSLLEKARSEQQVSERRDGLRQVLADAEALRTESRHDEAVRLLEQAKGRFDGEPALEQAKQSIRSEAERRARDERVHRALEAARQQVESGDPDAAAEALREALRQDDHPELRAFLAEAETRARGLRFGTAIAAAQTELAAKRFGQAVEVLRRAVAADPDQRLKDLLGQAERSLADQQRAEQIGRALATAEKALAGQQFDVAIETLRKADRAVGGDGSLKAALADAEARKVSHTRRTIVGGVVRDAESLLAKKRYPEAASAVAAALVKYADDPGLRQLQERIADESERERQQKRAEEIERAMASAASDLSRRQFDMAIQTLKRAEQSVGGDPGLAAAVSGAEAEKAAYTRQLAIDAATREAEALLQKKGFSEAAAVVAGAVAKFPDQPALRELQGRIEAQRRADEIQRALAAAATALAGQQFDTAIQTLKKADQTGGGDPRLASALSDAEARRAAYIRQSTIGAATRDAGDLLARKRYNDAASIVTAALVKFPDEPSLVELKGRIEAEAERDRLQQRAEEIERALASAKTALAGQQFDAAIQGLKKAEQSTGGDPRLTAAVSDAVARKAAHAQQAAIDAAVRDARDLIGKKRYNDAGAIVAAALAKFQNQPALLELQRRIEAEAEQDRRQKQRKADLDSLKNLAEQAAKAKKPEVLEQIAAKSAGIAPAYKGDREVAAAAARVQAEIEAARKRLEPKPAAVPKPEAAVPAVAPPAAVAAVAPAVAAPARKYWIYGAAAAAVLLGLGGIYYAVRKPAVAEHTLQVAVSTPGATLRVGSRTCAEPPCKFTLARGTYELRAQAPGYQAVVKPVAVTDRDLNLDVALQPLPMALRIATNLESGTVILDGRPVGVLKGGELVVQPVPTGAHSVRVSGPDGVEASLAFESETAQLPKTRGRVQTRNVKALTAATMGVKAAIVSELPGEQITVGGRELPASGVIEDLGTGTQEIKTGGQDGPAYGLGSSEAPTLNVFLHANRDTGTLLVETRQDGAAVFVDQKRYSRNTEQGMIRIPLAAGPHTIRVEKPGFQEPPQQTVEVMKDRLQRLSFELKPQPGTLVISGALPGTRVLLDGSVLGVLQGRGSFPVSPGEHTVELTKDHYVTRKLPLRVAPGAQFEIGRAEAQLAEAAPPPQQPSPQPPPPKVVEAPKTAPPPETVRADVRDWEALKDSRDVAALEAFRRKYGNSPLAEQAEKKLERIEWETASNSRDPRTLREFAEKYPGSSSAEAARKQADQLEWEGLNKKDPTALRAFVAQHPASPYRQQAEAEAARLGAADRAARDREEVAQVLERYVHAFESKDIGAVQAVWPGIPASTATAFKRTFKDARSISLQLRPTSIQIDGDSAVANCSRQLRQVMDRPMEVSNTALIRLRRGDKGWTIQSIE